MKILFAVDSFSGGAGNVIQILASGFAEKNYKVSVLLLNGKKIEQKYDMHGAEVIDFPLSVYAKGYTPIDRVYNSVQAIKKQFNSINPDVIVSFLTENNILCCIANKGKKPIIISERNDPFIEKHKKYWDFLRILKYPKADKIVVQCSNFKYFCNGRFTKNTVVIPNPILKPNTYHVPHNKDEITLIALGRLQSQKNFSWLIDRMYSIHNANKNVSLKIYGEGPLENQLRLQINQLNLQDCVELAGFTSTAHETLAKADIYVMTSDYEGFPNALSEAMAVGLPSVSRKCHDGIYDLVQNGVNGFTVETDDIDGFENRVLELASDFTLRTIISENAKSVSNDFSIEKIVDIWENSVNEIKL